VPDEIAHFGHLLISVIALTEPSQKGGIIGVSWQLATTFSEQNKKILLQCRISDLF
jgi:hypothetical protein